MSLIGAAFEEANSVVAKALAFSSAVFATTSWPSLVYQIEGIFDGPLLFPLAYAYA